MYPLKDTVRISWAYGHQRLAKKRFGRNYFLREFHHLRIIEAGHWEYMGHTIRRMEREEYSWRKDRYLWVIIRKSDGSRYNPHDEFEFYSTKDAARWRLYNDYIRLAEQVVAIEMEE